MRRNATLSLDDLDPDVLEAVRDVARRAGVPLATWLESVVESETNGRAAETKQVSSKAPAGAEKRRHKRASSEAAPHRTRGPVIEATPAMLPRTERADPAQEAVAAAPDWSRTVGASIGEMMRRLDVLDRSLTQERNISDDTARRAIEKLESRIATAFEGAKPAEKLVDRIADIERRMGELHTQIAAPRPLGRRGRPLADEVRDAVEKVRERQRELDKGGELAPHAAAGAPEPSPAITDLQRETMRLRESLGSLATGRDVCALEQAMRSLVTDVQRVREPSDIAAIAEPIAMIRSQVDRLADDVAENVHARVSGEVERLTAKVEGALGSTPSGVADRSALDDMFSELGEMRRLIAALAGPERIQGLAQSLQAISTQISQLQNSAPSSAPTLDELKPLFEEICRDLKAPDSSKAILKRIDALALKIDRVADPADLIGRLENLGESLHRPSPQDGDLAVIQTMLGSLAEKVDHVRLGGPEGLDALEQQVVGIARRLDARGTDPAVAGLERMMKELLGQVSSLRDGNAIEAAVERATRRALADTMRSERTAAGSGGMDLLRADLVELTSRQNAADQRIQSTMGNVNAALERLFERLGSTSAADPLASATTSAGSAAKIAAQSGTERPLVERLSESTSVIVTSPVVLETLPTAIKTAADPAPDHCPIQQAEAPRPSKPDTMQLGDELLEPGARRPRRPAPPEQGKPASINVDIKANFIAAARRAAQAAEADVKPPSAAERARIVSETGAGSVPTAALRGTGLVERLRGEADRRRRPLLLGLAAIVLILGAYQAFDLGAGEPSAELGASFATATPVTPEPKVAEVSPAAEPAPTAASQAPIQALVQATPAKAVPPEPQTTQSISEPAAPSPAATTQVIPKVTGMEAFQGDLAGVPTALLALRQAALDGDGAAIYELAAREADGRGLPRDLAIASKLFEKLATAGYAPAQFKLGSAYEKGSGVVRDLTQAKLWYGRAAEQGNIRSMHNLAVLYAENTGSDGKPDFASASSWFRRAAEYGVRDSQYNLAVLYARGLGLTQDLIQSYAWFTAAASQGDEEASKKRDDVANKLTPKDLATAQSVAAAYRPKTVEPSVNDVPAAKAAAAAPMSLLGAPPPGSAAPNRSTSPRSPSRPIPAGA